MASAHNPLNLTPLEVNTMNMAFGSSYDMSYGELGYAVSAMMKGLHEPSFRPRFMKMCSSGLLTFSSWKEMGTELRSRRVVTTPKTLQALRDLGIWYGGDPYYYKYFQPDEDYSTDPSKLDKFSPSNNRFGFKAKRKPTRAEVLSKAKRPAPSMKNFFFG